MTVKRLFQGPDDLIEVTIEDLSVECGKGLVVVFDGWELNGHVFPSEEDHEKKMLERSQVC